MFSQSELLPDVERFYIVLSNWSSVAMSITSGTSWLRYSSALCDSHRHMTSVILLGHMTTVSSTYGYEPPAPGETNRIETSVWLLCKFATKLNAIGNDCIFQNLWSDSLILEKVCTASVTCRWMKTSALALWLRSHHILHIMGDNLNVCRNQRRSRDSDGCTSF